MVDTRAGKQGEAGEPRLFGIAQSNRRPDELWGKNSFNNAFPVALACYMWEQAIPTAGTGGSAPNAALTRLSISQPRSTSRTARACR